MKSAPQFQPPRSAVIFHHTRRMLHDTSLCAEAFGMRLTEEYMRLVAPDARHVPLKWGVTGADLVRAKKANGQIVNRYLNGTVKVFPADLEDAWVRAMSSPYREDLEADLASRRDCLAVKRLVDTEEGDVAGLSTLAKEFAELVASIAPALADGRIDAADLPHAKKILRESDDLVAAVLSIRKKVTELLPDIPRPS
jgi:hypothetical protein